MVLSKRERYIGFGAAAALGLLAANFLIVSPYLASLSSTEDQIIARTADKRSADDLLNHQRQLQKIWQAMQAGGLQTDASLAERQAENAITTWAQPAGFRLTGLAPGRSSIEGQFQVINLTVEGTSTTPSLARFLWAIETAKIPIRVSELKVNSATAGTDQLKVSMNVSTLCLLPDSQKVAKGMDSTSLAMEQP